MEPALLGSVLTAAAGILTLIVHKLNCAYRRTPEGECAPLCSFRDAPLEDETEIEVQQLRHAPGPGEVGEPFLLHAPVRRESAPRGQGAHQQPVVQPSADAGSGREQQRRLGTGGADAQGHVRSNDP